MRAPYLLPTQTAMVTRREMSRAARLLAIYAAIPEGALPYGACDRLLAAMTRSLLH